MATPQHNHSSNQQSCEPCAASASKKRPSWSQPTGADSMSKSASHKVRQVSSTASARCESPRYCSHKKACLHRGRTLHSLGCPKAPRGPELQSDKKHRRSHSTDLQRCMLEIDKFDDTVAGADGDEVACRARIHGYRHLTELQKTKEQGAMCTHMFKTENLTDSILLPIKPHDRSWVQE